MTIIDVEFAGRHIKFFEDGRPDQSARNLASGFEAPLPIILMATVNRLPGTFIDVGANSGLYTILAAMTLPEVKIEAFEPLPDCVKIFLANVNANNLASRVKLHQIALSDEAGLAEMFLPSDGHGLLETSASLESSFAPERWAKSLTVKKARLDDLSIEGPVTVIKADIEGHEASFVAGATTTIERFRPIMFVEVLRQANFTFFTAFARDNDYIPFRLRPTFAMHTTEFSFDIQAWNWALIPKERIDLFSDACKAHNVEMVQSFRQQPA